MKDGFIKSACAVPEIAVLNPRRNAAAVIGLIEEAHRGGVSLLVFPELCLSGGTAGDLIRQDAVLAAAADGLKRIAAATSGKDMLVFVGLPLERRGRVHSVAAALFGGAVLGFVPQSNSNCCCGGSAADTVHFAGGEVPFGTDILFEAKSIPGFTVAATVGDGFAVPCADANIVVNLAADSEGVGRMQYRKTRILAASSAAAAGYIYANAGAGESTGDRVFSGHSMIAENGVVLGESKPFTTGLTVVTDIDVRFLAFARKRSGALCGACVCRSVAFEPKLRPTELSRTFRQLPFVPNCPDEIKSRAELIGGIQAHGLAERMRKINAHALVLGVSGGLDSTLALLVSVRAAALCGLDLSAIHALSMPAFGTSGRTKNNARALCRTLGVTFKEINITKAVTVHLTDLKHDKTPDVAFENAQARERTQVLFDYANMVGGIVVGTGDLSEAALGFSTYNGDHMSSYNVNASVPKTLMRVLVREQASVAAPPLKKVLLDILDTPVSPELLPLELGEPAQKTEEIVGPYVLHDFFLYHFIRRGAGFDKLLRLSCRAFDGTFTEAQIKTHLTTFFKRFFTAQFKRSCVPDAPSIGSVSLSPRGMFSMPSDADAGAFLKDFNDGED